MLVKLGVRDGFRFRPFLPTDALRQSGIHVFIGQRAENVDGADIVIYSAAIAKSNPERVPSGSAEWSATLLGHRWRISPRRQRLRRTAETTSLILKGDAGYRLWPTVHIGGQLDYIGGSTRVGGHDTFVVEACSVQRELPPIP